MRHALGICAADERTGFSPRRSGPHPEVKNDFGLAAVGEELRAAGHHRHHHLVPADDRRRPAHRQPVRAPPPSRSSFAAGLARMIGIGVQAFVIIAGDARAAADRRHAALASYGGSVARGQLLSCSPSSCASPIPLPFGSVRCRRGNQLRQRCHAEMVDARSSKRHRNKQLVQRSSIVRRRHPLRPAQLAARRQGHPVQQRPATNLRSRDFTSRASSPPTAGWRRSVPAERRRRSASTRRATCSPVRRRLPSPSLHRRCRAAGLSDVPRRAEHCNRSAGASPTRSTTR